MDLKVRTSGLLRQPYNFFEGDRLRFSLSNTSLISHGDSIAGGRNVTFRSRGLVRRVFIMQQDGHILATARRQGLVSWYYNIELDGRQYLLQGDSLWKMTLYLGGMPVGSVSRDELLPFDGFVWGFDGIHNSLWSFSFWLALKYWTGRRESRKPPGVDNNPGSIRWG